VPNKLVITFAVIIGKRLPVSSCNSRRLNTVSNNTLICDSNMTSVVHRKTNSLHWVSSSIYFWCSSNMIRHLRAILRERLFACEDGKTRQLNMVSGSVRLCALGAGIRCCGLLENTTPHTKTNQHTVRISSRHRRPYLAAQFLHTDKDKDAPWGRHVGAETCRSCIKNKYLTEPNVQCWFFYAQTSNARYKHQMTSFVCYFEKTPNVLIYFLRQQLNCDCLNVMVI
jgi:hypothetical protein